MSSYPPRRTIFPRGTPAAVANNNDPPGDREATAASAAPVVAVVAASPSIEGPPSVPVAVPAPGEQREQRDAAAAADAGSVSSAGTDRASNRGGDDNNNNNSNNNNGGGGNNAMNNSGRDPRGGGGLVASGRSRHGRMPQTSSIASPTTTQPQPMTTTTTTTMPPVPTTVVAAVGTSAETGHTTVKLTAEALAKNDQVLLANVGGGDGKGAGDIFGIVEVSSNLSRSSSESRYLKNLSNSGNLNNNNNGSGSGSNNAINTKGVGEDVSSLGSLAEDVLLPTALALDATADRLVPVETASPEGEGGGRLRHRELSEMALSVHPVAAEVRDHPLTEVHPLAEMGSASNNNRTTEVHPLAEMELTDQPTLSAETPPKDNTFNGNSNSNNNNNSNHSGNIASALERIDRPPLSPPIELARLISAQTPPGSDPKHFVDDSNRSPAENRLLPMGGRGHKKRIVTQVDSAIASIRPPSTPRPTATTATMGGSGNNGGSGSGSGGVPSRAPASPYPASPRPPSAIRVGGYVVTNSPGGPSFHRNASSANGNGNNNSNNSNNSGGSANGGRRATFQDPNDPLRPQQPSHTRTSSNASSCGTRPGGDNRIRLGICAMDKKARSKPMSEILKRLDPSTFEPVFFGDNVILNEAVEDWPACDVLVAFYSNGYPLEKAERYVALRQPYLLNDLRMQRTLMDRRRVYDLLEESGIDVPRHVFMSRDGYVSKGTGDGPKGGADEGGAEGGAANAVAPSSSYVGYEDEPEIDEHDDHVEVNGVVINKPFVEKPVDADDHNIAIYYPSSAGGGCKKLFRKVGDRSSEFYPEINEIRRDGSYIYEEFIETQGTDVKMYTVGPDYGHAEARKSPTVDGKVERNADGKEVRFPVILTLREKEIARRIVLVFKQQVCGFDILRIQEGDSLVSYVCDVNGWSFVKNSRKYYDDCAQILTEHMLAALKPKSKVYFSTLAPLRVTMEDHTGADASGRKDKKKKNRSLRDARKKSIADRVKMMLMGQMNDDDEEGEEAEEMPLEEEDDRAVEDEKKDRVFDDGSFGSGGFGNKGAEQPGDTYEEPVDFTTNPVRNLPDQLATEPASSSSIVPSGASSLAEPDDMSIRSGNPSVTGVAGFHQEELRCIITIIRHGDRTPKQKLKGIIDGEHFLRYFHNHTKKVKKDLKIKKKKDMEAFLETVKAVIRDMEAEDDDAKNRHLLYKARHIRDILTRWKFSGLNRKLQMKPRKWIEDACSELQLIVKWGGDLTKLGERQAVRLGNRIRNELYPSNKDGGILRLHSTFRHDLKIKTSDEGRVMKTAAAFAKGMLELEGDIPPILVSLVHKEKDSRHMLDPSGNKEVKKDLDKCKEMINRNMQKDVDYEKMTKEEREGLVGPERLASLHRALREIGNPRKRLIAIHSTIGRLVSQLDEMLGELLSGDEEVIEGGSGLRSRNDDDEALSGIKLYKGETLLELTERWKLLQNKLYNEETDTFDLSRVPDVHDNVRFDMLHNPHLGLTETLQTLYDLAKSMADCVVPQEYGIAIEEKRDIGSKMCHTLLEKINYDLAIARTDNQVDMRYLINMDYSADLPINSMGRRVRSRLYFTSESHLHSMLNVLRFPSIVASPLSLEGQEILANASELCYLTQVVFRLFEDTQKPSEDPRRFRVEILFSPGATATPLHMAELYREKDATRFDTEQLQKISIDSLTCAEVEEYFAEAIKEGKTEDEESDEVETVSEGKKDKGKKDKGEKDSTPKSKEASSSVTKQGGEAEKMSISAKATGVNVGKKVTHDKHAPSEANQPRNITDNPETRTEDAVTQSDSDQKANDEKNADLFGRYATGFGLLLGAGCLLIMSGAAKGLLKSRR